MKKKILIALVLCLVLILSVALVACGSKDTSTPDATPTTQGDGGNSGGQSGGNSGGSSGGGNSGGSGGDSGSGSGGGQGGGSHTLTRTLPTETAILEVVGTTSFKISVGNLSGTAITTVATNGTYYYYADPGEHFGKIIGNKAYPYIKTSQNAKYTKINNPLTSVPNMIHMQNIANLFLYAGETISYETETDVTFIGRAAKKYTATFIDPGNNAYVQEIIIDNLTGACLKHDSGNAPTDSFVSGNSRMSFAATEIAYGTDSAISTFLNPYVSKIDVFEWDTALFAQAGLDTSVIANPASNWMLYSSVFEDDQTRTDTYPDLTIKYNYYTDDVAGTKNAIKAFIETFYTAGAQKDGDGDQKEFNELCGWSESDRAYDFAGVVQTTSYCIEIVARNSTYFENPHWEIIVEVRKVEP